MQGIQDTKHCGSLEMTMQEAGIGKQTTHNSQDQQTCFGGSYGTHCLGDRMNVSLN